MFEELFPPHQLPVRSLCFRCPVEPREFDQVTLASGDEVATFAVDKRRDEHLSGRWLLAQALNQWGLDPTQIEVRRTELRAPVLAHLPGLWVNTPLPSVSIGHAGGWAYVALVEPGWSIGIDAELSDRGIASNAFDMMIYKIKCERTLLNPLPPSCTTSQRNPRPIRIAIAKSLTTNVLDTMDSV